MAGNQIGKIAGKWLKAKVDELTTTDHHVRDQAAADADQLEREAQASATESAVFAAAPGLREFKEKQEAAKLSREVEREEERVAELRARPLAGVGLAVSGVFQGEMSTHLPVRADVETADADDEANDPTSEWYDPYAHTTLVVELTALPGVEPTIGGLPFSEWGFSVPGYAGDGVYDLVAIHTERDRRSMAPDYTDCLLVFDEPDDPYYFNPWDGAPASVTVSGDGKTLDVVMTLTSSGGNLTVSASLHLP